MAIMKFYATEADQTPNIYDTEAEAIDDARYSLSLYRESAHQEGEWMRDVEDIVVGRVEIVGSDPDAYVYTVTHRATAVGDNDKGYDYKLKAVEPADATARPDIR